MAVFNPVAPEVAARDETNRSQGIGTSHVFSTLFGGIGKLLGDFAAAKDEQNQRDIYNATVAGRDAAAQPYIDALNASGATSLPGAAGTTAGVPGVPQPSPFQWRPGGVAGAGGVAGVDQTTTGATAPAPALPGELKDAQTRMDVFRDGLENGTITRTYYDSQVLSLAKGLRSKYPGYGKEIDSIVQNVTGMDPVNALVGDYFEIARANASNAAATEKAWQSYIDSNQEIIGIVAPDVSLNPSKYAAPVARAEVKYRVQQYAAQQEKYTADKRRYEAAEAAGKNVDKDILRNAKDFAAWQGRQTIMTINQIDKTLLADIDQAAGGGVIAPARIEQMRSVGAQVRSIVVNNVNTWLDSPDSVTGRTPGATMSQQDRQSVISAATSRIDTVLDHINNKEYGLASKAAREVQLIEDGAVLDIYAQDQTAIQIAAKRRIGGDTAIIEGISRNSQFASDVSKFYGGNYDLPSAAGLAKSLSKTADDIRANVPGDAATKQKITSEAMSGHIKNSINVLRTIDNPEVIANVAKYLYGPDNVSFMADYVDDAARPGIYAVLSDPVVAKKIFESTKSNPEIFKAYSAWVAQVGQSLYKSSADKLQEGIRQDKAVKWTYDPVTHQVGHTVDPASPLGQFTRPMNPAQAAWAFLSLSPADAFSGLVITPGAVQGEKDLNLVLSRVANVAELLGQDPNVAIAGLFQSMGVDFTAPREGNVIDTIGSVVGNYLQFGVQQGKTLEDIRGGVSPEKAAEQFLGTQGVQPGIDTSTTRSLPDQRSSLESLGAAPASIQAANTAPTREQLTTNVAAHRPDALPAKGPRVMQPTEALFSGASAPVTKAITAVSKQTGGKVAEVAPSGLPITDITGDSPVAVARSFLGKNERDDAVALSAFIKKAAGIGINPATTAWCAAWANAVLASSGYVQGRGGGAKGTVGNGMWARDFENYGTDARANPSEGDIVTFRWKNGGGHVGFFMGYTEDGKYVKVLGGNQGGAAQGGGGVTITLEPADAVYAIRRPEQAPTSTAGKAGTKVDVSGMTKEGVKPASATTAGETAANEQDPKQLQQQFDTLDKQIKDVIKAGGRAPENWIRTRQLLKDQLDQLTKRPS